MEHCIFKADELKHLCVMVKCPEVNQNKERFEQSKCQCITRAYCRLVEAYVKLNKEKENENKRIVNCNK